MSKYKARLKDINSLEFAETKAKSRLTHVRKSMVRSDYSYCQSSDNSPLGGSFYKLYTVLILQKVLVWIILIAWHWHGCFSTCSSHSSFKWWRNSFQLHEQLAWFSHGHGRSSLLYVCVFYIFHPQSLLCFCNTSKMLTKTHSRGISCWHAISVIFIEATHVQRTLLL